MWAIGSAMFGAGIAMAYPALIAAVGDVAGIGTAILVIAAITAISGIDVAMRMYETRRR